MDGGSGFSTKSGANSSRQIVHVLSFVKALLLKAVAYSCTAISQSTVSPIALRRKRDAPFTSRLMLTLLEDRCRRLKKYQHYSPKVPNCYSIRCRK